MPPALVAALPAIATAASAAGGAVSAIKAAGGAKREGDRADKILRQGEAERKYIQDSILGGPEPQNNVGIKTASLDNTGIAPVGFEAGQGKSLLKKPMQANGMTGNLGGLSRFG